MIVRCKCIHELKKKECLTPFLNTASKKLQYPELKCMDSKSRQIGIALITAMTAIIQSSLSGM